MESYERIKKIRQFFNLTQKEFAEKLDFTHAKIRDLEVGHLKVTAEIAILLEKKLNINLRWTLLEEEPMFIKNKKASSYDFSEIETEKKLDEEDKLLLKEVFKNEMIKNALKKLIEAKNGSEKAIAELRMFIDGVEFIINKEKI